MKVKFVGKDHVYHGSQSREGTVGVICKESPFPKGDGSIVYYAPSSWNGSVALTRLDQLK